MLNCCAPCLASHGPGVTSCTHLCHGPLPKIFYDLMGELEKLPASEQQTKCVIELGKLRDRVLREFIWGVVNNVDEFIPTGDMFWDAEDTEMSQSDPSDWLNDLDDYEIMEFSQALNLPHFFGFATTNDDTGDQTQHYFHTKEEAEKAVARIKAAIQEAKADD
jgi:hypothetical protein